jgi:hypothetical protein
MIVVTDEIQGKISGIVHEGANEIRGLTIDMGSVSSTWPYKRNGLYSASLGDAGCDRSTIDDVHVMRYHGARIERDNEGFGFICGGPVTLRGCMVSHPSGDYTLGFTAGDSFAFYGCMAVLREPNLTNIHSAFGIGWAHNARIVNCQSIGGNCGVYYDTHDVDGVEICDNTFVGCVRGVEIRNQYQETIYQGVKRVAVRRNKILLTADPPESDTLPAHVVAVALVNNRHDGQQIASTTGFIDDTVIEDNLIGMDYSASPKRFGRGLRRAVELATNCQESHSGKAGINGVLIRDNQYQDCGDGEPWTHRNKLGQAMGVRVENEQELRWAT